MDAFKMCGGISYVVVMLAMLAFVTALVGLLVGAFRGRAGAWVGIGALVLGISVAGTGVLGTALGMARVDAALSNASVDEAYKARIREEGELEARTCTQIGLTSSVLPCALALAAVVVGFVRRRAP